MTTPTVLFLCTHNAGRSQMALGFFNHLAGDQGVAWSGRSEPGTEINPAAVQAMAEIAEAAEHAPEIHGRARSVRPDTPAAAVMHAAVELAEQLDAVALVVPTASGGAPRACAKYRSKLPIIALAHDARVADKAEAITVGRMAGSTM